MDHSSFILIFSMKAFLPALMALQENENWPTSFSKPILLMYLNCHLLFAASILKWHYFSLTYSVLHSSVIVSNTFFVFSHNYIMKP